MAPRVGLELLPLVNNEARFLWARKSSWAVKYGSAVKFRLVVLGVAREEVPAGKASRSDLVERGAAYHFDQGDQFDTKDIHVGMPPSAYRRWPPRVLPAVRHHHAPGR